MHLQGNNYRDQPDVESNINLRHKGLDSVTSQQEAILHSHMVIHIYNNSIS